MKIFHSAVFWVIWGLAIAIASPVQAEDPIRQEMPYETARRLLYVSTQEGEEWRDIDFVAETQALGALFAVANAYIPESSTCQGHWHYRPPEKSTVKDMLAMLFSGLYSGKNVIRGNCESEQCAVRITHEDGESVSSATIVFNLVQGKASLPTLQCVITP